MEGNGNNGSCGWGDLWGPLIGGLVGGYAGTGGFGGCGRGGFGATAAYGCQGGVAVGGCCDPCQTCFQQGVAAGQNNAGLDYIGQQVAGNTNRINAVNDNINERFGQFLQLQLADKNAEIAQLKNADVVKSGNCQTQNMLGLILQTLQGITTGCAVRAVPACPPCPPCPAA